MYDILELNKKLVSELRDIAKELKVKRVEALRKQDLVYKILDQQAVQSADKSVKNKSQEESSLKRDRQRRPPKVRKEMPSETKVAEDPGSRKKIRVVFH